MTGVTQDQDGAGLSAADERLLRKPTKRARAGGLKLAGERGVLGPDGLAAIGDVMAAQRLIAIG